MARVMVLGIAAGQPISQALRARVAAAHLIAGGARQLALFPEACGERIVIGNNIAELVARLQACLQAGQEAVVLASGDPLLYGIGATLRREFNADQLEIVPNVSAVQHAFAAIAEPWHDALILSAHGRPLESVIEALIPLRKAAILTDSTHTPAMIAQQLLHLDDDCTAIVCERMGLPAERIVRGRLSELAQQTFDALNVMLIVPHTSYANNRAFGISDEALEHDGLITHLEVRAVSLAALHLTPTSIVWDIGAGSGAVALDAARIAYRGRVFAVERDAARYARLGRNLQAHGTGRVRAVLGEAPSVCAGWPEPDAIFVGGSGGHMEGIIACAAQRLRPDGRIVINLISLEKLGAALALLRQHALKTAVTQVSVARARPLQADVYLAALNPVHILAAQRAPGASS